MMNCLRAKRQSANEGAELLSLISKGVEMTPSVDLSIQQLADIYAHYAEPKMYVSHADHRLHNTKYKRRIFSSNSMTDDVIFV